MRANLLWYIRLMLVLCLFVLLFLCVLYLISDRSSRQLMEETVHQQQTYLARGATMVGDEISAFWGTQVDLLQKTDAINDLATATTLQPAHYADMSKAQNALTNILGKRNDSHPFCWCWIKGTASPFPPAPFTTTCAKAWKMACFPSTGWAMKRSWNSCAKTPILALPWPMCRCSLTNPARTAFCAKIPIFPSSAS